MAEFFYIEQQYSRTNFDKPFCVSNLLVYFSPFTYILYGRGCGPVEI